MTYLDPEAAAASIAAVEEPGPVARAVANHGDWQLGIYLAGLEGVRPELPMDFAELARRAEEAHVARDLVVRRRRRGRRDDAGRERARRSHRYGLMPRMLAGAAERDVSVELFGQRLPTPLMFAPVGVIGLCADDGHGDLATARAAVGDRRTDDRLDAVAGPAGGRGGRARRAPRAGSSSTRPTTASSPRAWCTGPRPPATRRS